MTTKDTYLTLQDHWKHRRFNYGMTGDELSDLCKAVDIPLNKFWKELGVNTCAVDAPTNTVLYYYTDIERTLAQIKHYRPVSGMTWD